MGNEERKKQNFFISLFKKNKALSIGLLSVILLLFLLFKGAEPQNTTTNDKDIYNMQYTENLEQSLKRAVSGIEGIESCEIIVTLEGGIEYIYASDNKQSLINNENQRESKEEENSVAVLSDKQLGEKAVIIKEVYPEIRGVAAVCKGENTSSVTLQVTNTLSKVLGIGADKICVIIE